MPEDSRAASAEQRLKELGIKLPTPPEPFGTYVEAVQTGNLLFLTGMLPTEGRRAKFVGRIGAERAQSRWSTAQRAIPLRRAASDKIRPWFGQSVSADNMMEHFSAERIGKFRIDRVQPSLSSLTKSAGEGYSHFGSKERDWRACTTCAPWQCVRPVLKEADTDEPR
jgi:hypothetical protein